MKWLDRETGGDGAVLRKQRCRVGGEGERGWEDELGGNKLQCPRDPQEVSEPQVALAVPHRGKNIRLHPLAALALAHTA